MIASSSSSSPYILTIISAAHKHPLREFGGRNLIRADFAGKIIPLLKHICKNPPSKKFIHLIDNLYCLNAPVSFLCALWAFASELNALEGWLTFALTSTSWRPLKDSSSESERAMPVRCYHIVEKYY